MTRTTDRVVDLAHAGDAPVGGKAAHLARLAAAGFPVPPGRRSPATQ